MNDKNAFAIAYEYHELGHCVIPSGGGRDGKSALIQWKPYQTSRPTETQLQEWQNNLNPTVWAMVTGPVSGCFVIDCDTPEAIGRMEATGLKPHVKTRKGYHYYCHWPAWTVRNSSRLLPGVDVRGEGGYVNFAGGNGKTNYEVLIIPADDTFYAVEQLPKEIQKILHQKPTTTRHPNIDDTDELIAEGQRNDALTRIGGALRHKGLSAGAIFKALRAINQEQCSPPLDDDEVRRIADSVGRYPPDDTMKFNLTDMGNAERLIRQYGDILRYSYERKKWLVWTGKLWQWDDGAKVTQLAKFTVRSIYQEAGNEPDEKRRKELADHARRSESDHRISAMISLAQSEAGIPVAIDKLDSNSWLLNVNNGTIDLKAGILQPHNPADLITKIIPLDYQPEATSEVWQGFLNKIFEGKAALISYIQRALGCSITGDQGEQAFFFCHGVGWNGKSTLLGAVQDILGPYAAEIDPSAFMVNKNPSSGPNESIARLCKTRFVSSTELEDEQRLSVSLIKRMTGGETLRCERKYEHGYDFLPEFKLWLSGNHEPIITDTTSSVWNRLKKIPFKVSIPEGERIKGFRFILSRQHGQAILAWLVKGCLDWQCHGLGEAPDILEATQAYRDSQDILHDFLIETCIAQPSAIITAAELYRAYKEWCDHNEEKYPLGKLNFNARIAEKGFVKAPGPANKTMWHGIRLLTDTEKVKSVNSVNSFPIKSHMREIQEKGSEKRLTELTNLTNLDDIPKYPTEPCEAILGVPVKKAIELWRSEGAPVIHLGLGENCLDLGKLLSRPDVSNRHLEAVRTWIEKRTDKPGKQGQ